MKKNRAIFIGATGQNVGKTTLCLGIIAGLKQRFSKVGFIKPVGQQHVNVDENIIVDKDAVLFKKYFNLSSKWTDISPVIIPTGFTRDYLDGKKDEDGLLKDIVLAFQKIKQNHSYTVVEGTGHIGVGSIINLNNAKVASALGLETVIIASGGLGSSYDELALNIAMCQQYGISIRGVILNRVLDSKREMILDYFPRSLQKWNIPLIGCVPYNKFLSTPMMRDFETLFQTPLLSGERHHYRHFTNVRLVAGSLESYIEDVVENELVITPASRNDIVNAVIEKLRISEKTGKEFTGGLILTGTRLPSGQTLKQIQSVDIPALYAPICSYDAMKMIATHIAKIQIKDTPKIEEAIKLVEKHIDFNLLCE
jgi:phosphate acetyltransferase